jgi:glyoxylate reductase
VPLLVLIFPPIILRELMYSSATESWNALAEVGELVKPEARSREEFIEECKSGKLDGVLVAYRTFNSVDITGVFDEDLISVLPESLKFICHNGRFV